MQTPVNGEMWVIQYYPLINFLNITVLKVLAISDVIKVIFSTLGGRSSSTELI